MLPMGIFKHRGLKKWTRVAMTKVGSRVELVTLPEDVIQGLIGLSERPRSIEEIEAGGGHRMKDCFI